MCGHHFRNTLSERNDGISVYVRNEPQRCVAVDSGMFEVDPGCTVAADNDLELVVPSIGARSTLVFTVFSRNL